MSKSDVVAKCDAARTYILMSLTQGCNHGRTERKVGNKVPVHNIHVKPISSHIKHLLRISCEIRQIARQEGGSNQCSRHVDGGSLDVLA